MKSISGKISPYFILVLFVIIGFWQVSFFAYGLKWDIIDVVLPFRYHFSECIQSFNFPFWNPYQQTGTPFFSDLQAPTYYPELLFVSLFGGYGVYIIHILFVLYVVLAATGMYKLSYYFNKSPVASLMAGLAYSFSGYIIGHGQHFFLLVGTAWIPYVILYCFKLNHERKAIDAVRAGIFIFLMITGSYQALSITLMYLVVLLFIYFIFLALVQKRIKLMAELVKLNFLLFLIVVLLLSPLIVSTLEIFDSVGRLGEGVSLESTLDFGQSFKSILSFFTPFSTLKYPEFFGGVDASLTNHYFGIIPLIFFIAALSRKRSVPEYIILVFGLIILAMSFDSLPVRKFMYLHIPFMDLFLYAAYIRVFGLFAFIILSANYLAYFERNMTIEKNRIIAIASVGLGILLFLIIASVLKISTADFTALQSCNSLASLLKTMTFHQHILFQAIFQLTIVTLFTLVIVFYKKLKSPVNWIIILFLAEIFVAAQLNMSTTVIDANAKPNRMQKDLSLSPDGFPIPVNDKIIFNDQQHAFFMPFWRNTYIFTKQISFDSFSSFKLNSYSKLDEEYPNLKNAVLNNHLFYFSDRIWPLSHLSDSAIDIQNNAKDLYLSEEDFSNLAGRIVAKDSLDEVDILKFSPNEVLVKTTTSNDQFLTMLQTNFKGWKAFIDDTSTPVYTSNFNYRTIFLPKGNHTVRYEYKNNRILAFYIISNALFILCLLFLLGYRLYTKKHKKAIFVFIPLIILVILGALFIKLKQGDRSEPWTGEKAILSHRKDFANELIGYDSALKEFPGNNCYVVDSGIEFLPIIEIVNRNKKLNNTTMLVNTNIFPDSYSKALIVSEIVSENQSSEWHAVKLEKQIEHPGEWNDIIYCRNFYKLKENDVIKVYLWNPNKSNFMIEDVTVSFFD